MKYRGYEISRVPHNIPGWPPSTSAAVIDPEGNPVKVASDEVGQHVIDVLVDRGDWPNREAGTDAVGK